jgi:hypothetical protein
MQVGPGQLSGRAHPLDGAPAGVQGSGQVIDAQERLDGSGQRSRVVNYAIGQG